jgi:hypothetical protein
VLRLEGETAPFETAGTVITYPDGAITLWSDSIQLEHRGLSSTLIPPSTSTAAMSDVPLSTSVMSIDSNPSQSFGDETLSSSRLEVN